MFSSGTASQAPAGNVADCPAHGWAAMGGWSPLALVIPFVSRDNSRSRGLRARVSFDGLEQVKRED
jgi:hypothetical protein